jgi:hypothetical protein
MRLVLLTKSAKHKAFCCAGINLYRGNDWFARIVKNNDGEAVTDLDIANAKPLDLIEVATIGNQPVKNQQENFPIDFSVANPVKIIDRKTIDYVKDLYDGNRFEHTDFFGNNMPYLTEAEASRIRYSLSAIKVSELEIYTKPKLTGGDSYKVRFVYDGQTIDDISMTDPDYYGKPNTKIPAAILIVSLPSEGFGEDNKFYKFVAKIFDLS